MSTTNKEPLGDRMKNNYEKCYRISLPRRTNTIVRLDGRAFHTLTRNCEKPFDSRFITAMQYTANQLCQRVEQGIKLAYTQSDEISLLLTDYDSIKSDAWFDGNLQKICSITASIASVSFSRIYDVVAHFDSRVFIIPDPEDVVNYFVWRQQDATRNSINMVAQSLYSHKELQGKNSNELQELIFQKRQNWNDLPGCQKRGSVTVKTEDNVWATKTPPIFTQDRDFILNLMKPTTGVDDSGQT